MNLLFEQREKSIKINVRVDSVAKPILGTLSPNEAGMRGIWCFASNNSVIYTDELRKIANKLDKLNETRT